jgi:hypothetical protein
VGDGEDDGGNTQEDLDEGSKRARSHCDARKPP